MTTSKLKNFVKKFKNKKVLVLGDIGVDRYLLGKVERISPEAPVPVFEPTGFEDRLGLASNVANNIRAFGGHPVLLSIIGADAMGERVKVLLDQARIEHHLLMDADRKTTLKTRFVVDKHFLLRMDEESTEAVPGRLVGEVIEFLDQRLSDFDAVIFEDYGKGFLSYAVVEMTLRKAKDKLTILDPTSKTNMHPYAGLKYMTPNCKEAVALTGFLSSDPILLAMELLRKFSLEGSVLTLGGNGIMVCEKNSKISHHIEAQEKQVFDVCGAGDTVVAAMTLALCAGASLIEACEIANVAAGIQVSKFGTATVSTDELLREL
jgi:D-beta-D-heptose 7-phosphate kinase/D-beta-D-heptose 1-phosphate adenosyltransferase